MNEETNGTHNSCNTSIYYNTPNPSGPISDHLRTGVLLWSFERCLQEIRHPFVCVVLFFLQKKEAMWQVLNCLTAPGRKVTYYKVRQRLGRLGCYQCMCQVDI